MKNRTQYLGLKTIITLLVVIFSISSCKQLKELKNLSKCEFRLQSINLLTIENIDVSKIKTLSDIDFLTLTKLGNILLSGKMPLTYRANIEVFNPNKQKAGISKVSLHILFNNAELVQTTIQKHFEVLPGQKSMFPIELTSDIAQIMKGETIKGLLGLLFNNQDIPAVFTIKIKPSINIGPVVIDYPGFITLSKDFKSN